MDYSETWPRCPQAAKYLDTLFQSTVDSEPIIASMAVQFIENAGVDLRNLVDHWSIPDTPILRTEITEAGFVEHKTSDGESVWSVPGARLAKIRLISGLTQKHVAIAVEDVDQFLAANDLLELGRYGENDSAYEAANLPLSSLELIVLARRGYNGFHPGILTDQQRDALAELREEFANRPRRGNEADVVASAKAIVERFVPILGQARVCDEFFVAERDYYVTRNRAAQWIYERQLSLGFGWANHDHHTYRSTREGFYDLINFFHTMGFVSREKFYAGADAGWGAQVLEHPISRVVIFADLDMSPDELDIDYAQTRLPARSELGTIGLWCGLHTSSIAEAGMHHIECEYDFAAASELFEGEGFKVMKPFTDLEILKQRFTEPELWKIAPERLQCLLDTGAITSEQAEKFRENGAAGSHLEILQRWEGFKGFNKTGVSSIIRETDARR